MFSITALSNQEAIIEALESYELLNELNEPQIDFYFESKEGDRLLFSYEGGVGLDVQNEIQKALKNYFKEKIPNLTISLS